MWRSCDDWGSTSDRPNISKTTHCSRFVHYDDVIMSAIASQITNLAIVYSTVYSDADQRKHQSTASLAFVWGIHRGPVNSPHKGPVPRKIFPFGDVIMLCICMDHVVYGSAIERRRYYVTPSLIGRAPIQNDPCICGLSLSNCTRAAKCRPQGSYPEKYRWKLVGQGRRSKFKVTRINTELCIVGPRQ